MSSVTFGVVAMILVGVSWIVWGYVAGVAPRRNLNMGLMVAGSAAMAIVICLASGALLYGLNSRGVVLHKELYPIFPVLNKGSLIVMGFVVLGGIFNFAQLQFMSKAMKYGPNGIIWSIVQAGFIVPFALGIICFGEKMSWAFAAAITLVIASLVLFAVTADNSSKGHWLMFALFSFFSTCMCQSMQYIPSNLAAADGVSSLWRTFSYFVGLFLGFVIACCFSRKMRQDTVALVKNKYTWLYALLIDAVEIFTCTCLFYPGMDALANSKIGAISTQLMTASGIVAFELYAVLLLKEKRNKWQITALLLCLASIAVICF